MTRAQLCNPIYTQKFFFRKDIHAPSPIHMHHPDPPQSSTTPTASPLAADPLATSTTSQSSATNLGPVEELTLDEIMNGDGKEFKGFAEDEYLERPEFV